MVESGKIIDDSYELIEVNPTAVKPDTKVQNILKEIESTYVDHINEVVGYSTIPLYRYFVVENPIDSMIVTALHWKFPKIDIALSNGFRFCPPRVSRDHTGNIPITNGFIFDMLPVDSRVRMGKASGKQLLEWLEKELNNVFSKDAAKRFGGWVVKFKGMQIAFNAFGDLGKRVQWVKVNGQPINAEQMYSIMACERDGDPADMICRIKGAVEIDNTKETLHQVMKEYLSKNSPVTPHPENNAQILDAPATLLTQVSGVDYQFR